MSENILEKMKEEDPLEYHTRSFHTQRGSVLNLVKSLKQGQLARVLKALLLYPLNDVKTTKDGKQIADLGLVTQQEKLVFDFCLKMLDHKANVLRLGTEQIIKMGKKKTMAKSVNIANLVKNKTKDGSKEYQAISFLEDVFVQVDGQNVTKPENAKNLMAFVSGSPMQVVEKYGVNFGKDKPRFGILEITKDYEGNVKDMRLTINKDVNIAKGSDILELNQYRTAFCNDPIENVEWLYKNGHIKDADIETRRQKASEASAWLLANVSVGIASSQ